MKHIPKTPFSTRLSGGAKETQLRLRSIFQWKKRPFPVWLFTLTVIVLLGCFGLVSCQQSELPPEMPEGPAVVEPEQKPQPEEPVEPAGIGLTGIERTLDDRGAGDDAVSLESYPSMEDWDGSSVVLTVTLGTGEELTRVWEATRAYPNLMFAPLIHPDRDCIVVELDDMTSTYGASATYVLEVADGQLVERLRFDGVSGTRVEGNTLRLAQLVSKWHGPEYYTAIWNEDGVQMIPDGFFTDELHLGSYPGQDGQNMELRLRLRGREDAGELVYDRVQVLNGEEVLQTIESAALDVLADRRQLRFLAETQTCIGGAEVLEVSFDGLFDFGILCDASSRNRRAWFVWDTHRQEFVFFGVLGGDLTVDETVWQLRETLGAQTNYYSVSQTGKLIPLRAPAEEDPRFAAQTADFKAVLRESATVLDASDALRERKITHTASGNTFTPGYFAVVDMDGTGAPEVVLWMTLSGNPYVGFDILRWEEGKVLSYSQVYRGLMGLKEDGTFSYSSGAFDNGYGRAALLSETGILIEDLVRCQSADNAEGAAFFIEGREVSGAEFNAALANQDEKPDVAWYELTRENIELLGGLLAAAG